MKPRHLALLAGLLAGCDEVPADTDGSVPSDTDALHTQPPDETDPLPVDTDTGTADVIPTARLQDLRQAKGDVGVGDVVRVTGLVVTAIASSPVAPGFAAQEPSAVPLPYSGVYVSLPAGASLPEVGSTVDLVGIWREDPLGDPTAATLDRTRATLELFGHPAAGWQATGSGPLPPPVYIEAASYSSVAEVYEGMRMRLSVTAQRMVVSEGPDADGEFMVGAVGLPRLAWVGGTFWRADQVLVDLGEGASFQSVQGVVMWDGLHEVSPTSASDLPGYQAPPIDEPHTDLPHTDETDETDVPHTDPLETDTGGYVWATDSGGHTGWVDPGLLDIRMVAAGIYESSYAGKVISLDEGVVTAVRRDVPTASKGFVLQHATAREDAAVYVVTANLTPPDVGDVVRVTGRYTEVVNGCCQPPNHTYSPTIPQIHVVQCDPGDACGYTVERSGEPLPAPVQLTIDQVQLNNAERYELMLVEVSASTPLAFTNVSYTNRITLGADTYSVGMGFNFWDFKANTSGVSLNDTVLMVRGPLFLDHLGYSVSPRSASDVVDFVDN